MSRYSTDYSRFADVGSDDEEVEEVRGGPAARPSPFQFGATSGPPPVLPFCRLAPGHSLSQLDAVYLTHPRDFVPSVDPERGWCHSWGLQPDPPSDESESLSRARSERHMTQMMLGNLYVMADFPRPEVQFAKFLAERKLQELSAARPALEVSFSSTYTLRYSLSAGRWSAEELRPPVWRRLRVSGGTSLFSLWDKLLCPAVGFCRNYHCSLWTDPRDGSQFGSPDSTAIDSMHMTHSGWLVADDKLVRLAQLLHSPGDFLTHLYDLGDGWAARLTLEEVHPDPLPFALLAGGGSCPPEDSNGLLHGGWARRARLRRVP